jgi:uncharacterized RDD family membrane protein YckC
MEILDQPTPPELIPANDGNRIVAYLIDSIIAGCFYAIPGLGWVVGGLIYSAYMLTRDALPFLDGQSIGKKAMKIRAVTADGQSLTNNYGASVVRNILLVVPFLAIVELIVMLTNPQKLRLGDQWAKTRVVEAR